MTTLNLNLCLVFADLLSYPDARLKLTAADCARQLKESAPQAAQPFTGFIDFLEQHDLPQIEEAYTATFDLQALCYPYVGYQLCGESQARTMFLMKLQEIYKQHAFTCGTELPDHLSVVLRFIGSIDDPSGNAEIINEALLPVLEKMIQGIETEQHPYRQLLSALQTYLAAQVGTDIGTDLPETKLQKGVDHG